MTTRIGAGEHTYAWQEDWAQIPETESARRGWAHSGVAVTAAGDVITYHQGEPLLLLFDRHGRLQCSWETDAGAAHGMCLVQEDGGEYLWVADNGARRAPAAGYEYRGGDTGPQVLKLDLFGAQTSHGQPGRTVQRLETPDLPPYREGKYSPTSVAVHERRFGGNGDVWVADGYGQHYVHRYSAAGDLGDPPGEAARVALARAEGTITSLK